MKSRFIAAIALAVLLTGSLPVMSVQAQQQATVVKEQKVERIETAAQTSASTNKANRTDASESPTTAVSDEEAAIVPYYKNFFSTYRLGPEDVISVIVFGQERYSKGGIQIPPNGRISYPLIPEGIQVAGKTVEQVQAELVKKLDEYIIDPKITVSLDQAKSTRYSVLGDVSVPGVKPMLRRLTVMEAIAEAGGVLPTGSKKNVQVLRRQSGGNLMPIPVNLSAIEKGRSPDNLYLIPGDQIIVPGNKIKKIQQILSFTSLASFASIFFRF